MKTKKEMISLALLEIDLSSKEIKMDRAIKSELSENRKE